MLFQSVSFSRGMPIDRLAKLSFFNAENHLTHYYGACLSFDKHWSNYAIVTWLLNYHDLSSLGQTRVEWRKPFHTCETNPLFTWSASVTVPKALLQLWDWHFHCKSIRLCWSGKPVKMQRVSATAPTHEKLSIILTLKISFIKSVIHRFRHRVLDYRNITQTPSHLRRKFEVSYVLC